MNEWDKWAEGKTYAEDDTSKYLTSLDTNRKR